ncbi:hypothetical protein CTAYLR_007636 [Chrysophaeum taylorii]|uniref:Proteasome subunit beta n=1 Tax=Chrysophaeum taylorii TaxID=2483200 RepID=A0AAD7XLJ0_9STRA|nr:hypothetical protein CTAYLR_007636 [Chrysophaeum taylorii]
MAGKGCVAVVADKRLGAGNALIGDGACRVLECGDRAVVAMRGLHADVQTLFEDLDSRLRLRWIEAGGRGTRAWIEPSALAAMVSVMLYAARLSPEEAHWFLEPIVAGLSRKGDAYLCAQDSLGAQLVSSKYVVVGTAAHSLHGACEALYEPDLDPHQLRDLAVRCMSAGLHRDCLSGRTLVVHLITPDGHTKSDHSVTFLSSTPRSSSSSP